MSTGFTSTDRASLKRALEFADEVRFDVKRIVSLLEEWTEKTDAWNENLEQIGRGFVECLAQVEDVGSQLTILKASWQRRREQHLAPEAARDFISSALWRLQ